MYIMYVYKSGLHKLHKYFNKKINIPYAILTKPR